MTCKLFPGKLSVFFNISLMGYSFPNHTIKIRNHHITSTVLNTAHQLPGSILCQPVVTVQKLQIFSLGLVQCLVPAVRDSGVLFMNNSNSGIPVQITVTDSPRIVSASIIYQNQLKICILLCQHTIDTAFQKLLRIIDRYNNRNQRLHIFPHSAL